MSDWAILVADIVSIAMMCRGFYLLGRAVERRAIHTPDAELLDRMGNGKEGV